jgi:hypothetical protein
MTKNQDFQLCADMGLQDMVKDWAKANPTLVETARVNLRRFLEIHKTPRALIEYAKLFQKLAFNTPGEISKGIDRTVELALIALDEISREELPFPSFFAHYGRKPEPGKDYDPDGSLSQDEFEYLSGTGRYSDNVEGARLDENRKETE